jgi:hypothetical protein
LNSIVFVFSVLPEAAVRGYVRLWMIDVAGGLGRAGGIGSASWGHDSKGGADL